MELMLFFHGGSQNRGCEAIVRTSTKILKDRLKQAKVNLVSMKPETDKIIKDLDNIYDGSDCAIKKYSYEWLISSLKVKLFKDESYAYRKIHNNVIKHIDEMDICLSIGGDNYCYGEQPGYYEINRKIKSKGKKLVLWACSIGEEDLSQSKLEDLKNFDLILARETLTYNILTEKGFNNVKLCADPAFTLDKEDLELPEGWKEGKTIGLNFSPLVFNKNNNSKGAIMELINYIINSTDLTIALTPHVIDLGNNDYEILHEFYECFKHTGRIIILPDYLNAQQYKGYIARMRYFIGARTHATIAAYSSLVPTMVLGYSIKSRGIAKDIFGEERLVLGLKDMSNSFRLISEFDDMVKNEIEIKKTLQLSIPRIEKMSYKASEYLRELV